MTREECREILFSLANSINALRSAKVGNEGFSLKMSKEFALRLEEAIHSTFSIKEEQVLKTLEDVRAEITGNLETIIGKYDSNTKPENMPSRKIERNNGRTEAIDIINRKIAEVTKNDN